MIYFFCYPPPIVSTMSTKPIIPDNLLAYRTWYNSTISETLPMCTHCKAKPMLWCTDTCECCASVEDLLTEIDILDWHVANFPRHRSTDSVSVTEQKGYA